MEVKTKAGWTATLSPFGKVDVFDPRGVWATSGQWTGSRIEDAPGDIDDKVFSAIDEALKKRAVRIRDEDHCLVWWDVLRPRWVGVVEEVNGLTRATARSITYDAGRWGDGDIDPCEEETFGSRYDAINGVEYWLTGQTF